jgi:RNA polymerase sigma factor FliA
MNEGELNAWRRCKQGDGAAREELILLYLPLVKFWASKISGVASWASREDLMQEGIKGLIIAVDKFDLKKNVEFSTYARFRIREAIFDSPELTRGLPRSQDENRRKITGIHDKLVSKLERKPTIEEIAEESGLTPEQVRNALDATCIAFPKDFPEPGESIGMSADTTDSHERIMLIQDALSRFSEREAIILTSYYWDEQPTAEIAKKLNLTEDNVRKVRQRAMSKLRKLLGI